MAGTILLGIGIAGSDLDILLCAHDLRALESGLRLLLSPYDAFGIYLADTRGSAAAVCNFEVDGLPIELFATEQDTHQQLAYRHLFKEHEILQPKGPAFADPIRALKVQGIKTEPAFARLLGLWGRPIPHST